MKTNDLGSRVDKLTIATARIQIEGKRVWEWVVSSSADSRLGAGLCATKADALNDAGIFVAMKLRE